MGYMGFGMRKEVYTRKPKSSFSRIKKVYGDHAEDFYHFKNRTGKWSDILKILRILYIKNFGRR